MPANIDKDILDKYNSDPFAGVGKGKSSKKKSVVDEVSSYDPFGDIDKKKSGGINGGTSSSGNSTTIKENSNPTSTSDISKKPTNRIDTDDFATSLAKDASQFKPTGGGAEVKMANLPKPKTLEETKKEKLDNDAKNIVERHQLKRKSVQDYNEKFGTSFNADEILASADKSADFLHTLKAGKAISMVQQYEARKKEAESKAEHPNGNYNFGIENPFDPDTFSNKSVGFIKEIQHNIVDKSIDEGREKNLTKDQTLHAIYKRVDPKGYQEVSEAVDKRAIISPSDFLSGGSFNKDNKGDFELLETHKAPIEFAYNEGLKRQANDRITMGTIAGNQSVIDDGKALQAQVKTDAEIYKQYPSLIKSHVAENIAKEIAQETGQLKGSDGNLSGKFFGYSPSAVAKTKAYQAALANPDTHDAALAVMANPGSISESSFFGSIGSNLMKPLKELYLSGMDLAGQRDQMDRLSDVTKEELFPEETPGLKGYVTKLRGAANTTANLVGYMAIQAATGGVAGELGASAKVAERAGTAMSFGLSGFDGNLKDADRFMKNDAGKVAYATLGAMINTAGGEMLDLGKISKFGELHSPIKNLAEMMTAENITKKGVNELLEKAKNPYINTLVKYGENVGKGAATMSYFTFANGVNRMLFSGEGNADELIQNTGKAFMDGVLGMSVLGGFGAHADLAKEKNSTYKHNVYEFAKNHDAARDVITTGYKNGEYDIHQYNEKIQILNTAVAATQHLSIAESTNNVKLNEQQKAVYVANRTAEGVIAKKLESPFLTEGKKSEYEAQIKRLAKQRDDVMNGLTFSNNFEPLNDIFKAQIEYKNTFEDFNNGKVEDDSEVMKAKEKLMQAHTDYKEGKDTPNPKLPDTKEDLVKDGVYHKNIRDDYFAQADFFTPQEKEKFQSLDEKGQGKMIDDKRTELSAGKEKEADKVEKEKLAKIPTPDDKIIPAFEEIKLKIPDTEVAATQDIVTKANNAEPINEKELENGLTGLYSALDAHPESAHLIEPLILKLQDYEFKTKTETRTVTEEEPTGRTTKVKKEIKPALEQSEGAKTTVTLADGSVRHGVLSIKSGQYVLDMKESPQIIIGEKAIIDRDLKLPDETRVPEPIGFDKDGNVESVTFETRDGNLVTIKDHEKALDIAIQLQANSIGEIPDAAFAEIFNTVQKEINTEVPVNDINSQSKTTENGSSKNGSEEKSSTKEKSSEENGKEANEGNVENSDEANVNKDGSADNNPAEPPVKPPVEVVKEFEKAGNDFSAITKARLSERESAAIMYNKESSTGWTEIHDKAMAKIQARYPDKAIYEGSKAQVAEQATYYDLGIDYNPTSTDIAVIQYLEAEIEHRMRQLNTETKDYLNMSAAMAKHGQLLEVLDNIDKASQTREGGTAFGMRNREVKIDYNSEAGLISRKIELKDKLGVEILNPKQNLDVEKLWEQEKANMQKQHEAKINSMKLQFEKKFADLKKEKAATKKETSSEKTLKQKGDDFAEKILKLKIKTDPNTLQSSIVGLPVAVYNLLIDGVSLAVKGGATVAEAIKTVLKEDSFKNVKEKDLIDHLTRGIENQENKAASFEEIKKFAASNNIDDVTKELVAKKHIQKYVDSYLGEHEPGDVIRQAAEDLKEILPQITEDKLREAYLKKGDFKIHTERELKTQQQKDKQELAKLLKIEKDIDDLEKKGDILSDKGNAGAEKVNNRKIEEKQQELKSALRASGRKLTNSDKYKKASNASRASSHNERVEQMSKKIQDRMDAGDLTDGQKEILSSIKEGLNKAIISLNPESRLDQTPVMENGLRELNKVMSTLDRFVKPDMAVKLPDLRSDIRGLATKFTNEQKQNEQDVLLSRTKDQLKSSNAEMVRKINAGEFENQKPVSLNKSDRELLSLQIEQNSIQSQYNKAAQKSKDQSKGFVVRSADLVRNTAVTNLIMGWGTLAKVAVAGTTRPTFEAVTKLSGGKLFNILFPEISIAAKRGGESNSLESIKRSYEAQFAQHGEAWISKVSEKAEEKYNKSSEVYEKKTDELFAMEDKDSKEYKQGVKELQQLKNERDSDMVGAISKSLYKFIGASSWGDATDSLIYRSNQIERTFGYLEKEGWKGGDAFDKANYLVGTVGRMHSLLKTFSARASFAAGFVARLEAAIADGTDLAADGALIQIAEHSYMDWERGKYQQGNFVTNMGNNIIKSIENYEKGTKNEAFSKAAAWLLRIDQPVTRVPVNILHEMVTEYAGGVFKAGVKVYMEYGKAKSEILSETDLKKGTEEFKAALKDRMQNMDAKAAANIVRAFRKGAFGLGLYGLVSITGAMHSGGFYQKGEKKKTAEELKEGELNAGEILLGKTKQSKLVAAVIEHTPAFFPCLFAQNGIRVLMQQIHNGETTPSAAYDAIMANFETMVNDIPQTKIVNPITIGTFFKNSAAKTLFPENSAPSILGGGETDADGNLIRRKSMNTEDNINLLRGYYEHFGGSKKYRGEVLTEVNYKAAQAIHNNYKKVIKNMYKNNDTQQNIDAKIEEREQAIKGVYSRNKAQFELLNPPERK